MDNHKKLSASGVIMKEVKDEIQDDPQLFSTANGVNFLDRVPKEEGGGLTVSMDNRIVPFAEKVIKEEIVDEEEYNPDTLMVTDDRLEYYLDNMVKEEDDDYDEYDEFERMDDSPCASMKVEPHFIKEEPEPVPEPSEPQSALIWRPSITSLNDFTSFDNIEDDEIDMALGSSILFNTERPERYLEIPKEPVERNVIPINFDDECDTNFADGNRDYMPKKPLPTQKMKRVLAERFADNMHPTAIEMVKIAEFCGVRYRTVFEDFETKRAQMCVVCLENDPCERIRSFFANDSDNMCYQRVKPNVKKILEDEIETHLLSRKRFSVGYVHVIMEKTNLPSAYIRGQYENWKKKMLTKARDEYKYKDGDNDHEDPSSLPMEILRKLEDAYLKKKYQCEETEWSPKEFKSLAAHLNIKEKTVTAWLEKRKDAVLGLDHDIVEMRKTRQTRMRAADGRKLPLIVTESLNAEFERNARPTLARRIVIAKKLKLNELQVRNYFNKKRIRLRRHTEWENARQDVIKMPREKVTMMEKIAAEKRKPTNEYIMEAQRIGVAQMTLISFVNWRKSVTASNQYKHANQYLT